MAQKTISDEDMLERALELFRTYGFDGVSLKQVADAMGMEKGSLYYRFPGGKDEIALKVVRSAYDVLRANVLQPLVSAGSSPRRRLRTACDSLRDFYADGSKPCVLDVLSIPGAPAPVKTTLRKLLDALIDAFSVVAREAGCPAAQARMRAEDAVVRIEGSLVLSRVLGDTAAFDRAMKQVLEMLTVA